MLGLLRRRATAAPGESDTARMAGRMRPPTGKAPFVLVRMYTESVQHASPPQWAIIKDLISMSSVSRIGRVLWYAGRATSIPYAFEGVECHVVA